MSLEPSFMPVMSTASWPGREPRIFPDWIFPGCCWISWFALPGKLSQLLQPAQPLLASPHLEWTVSSLRLSLAEQDCARHWSCERLLWLGKRVLPAPISAATGLRFGCMRESRSLRRRWILWLAWSCQQVMSHDSLNWIHALQTEANGKNCY